MRIHLTCSSISKADLLSTLADIRTQEGRRIHSEREREQETKTGREFDRPAFFAGWIEGRGIGGAAVVGIRIYVWVVVCRTSARIARNE